MIDKVKLSNTVNEMIRGGKCILAMDESSSTMSKRLEGVGVEPTEENIQAWRKLIVETPDLTGIGAAILFEGTVDQVIDGKSVPEILQARGIVPGVKTDKGKKPVISPYEENLTEGTDGLFARLQEFAKKGVRFTKFRSEFWIKEHTPSVKCIELNAQVQAIHARLCQEAGLVPMVEPEVRIEGKHCINRAYRVAQMVHSITFEHLQKAGVYMPGTILKPSLITPGSESERASAKEVGDATISCFLDNNLIPSDLGGISHLSGGLSDEDAALYLNAENSEENRAKIPWRVTASYGRAFIGEALTAWSGKSENVEKSQAILTERAKFVGLASDGKLPDNFKYELKA